MVQAPENTEQFSVLTITTTGITTFRLTTLSATLKKVPVCMTQILSWISQFGHYVYHYSECQNANFLAINAATDSFNVDIVTICHLAESQRIECHLSDTVMVK